MLYVSFPPHFGYSQHLMLAGTNVAKIYVSTNVSLLPQINIHRRRKNSQHYMLAHPDLNDISIDTHKQEIFTIFMVEDYVYITCSLDLVKVEVITNIQC